MKKQKQNHVIAIIAAILNVIAISCVIISVVRSVNVFKDSSFSQNVENIRTLTDSSANKVNLLMSNYASDVLNAADYVNKYNGVGMTESEITDYFQAYYGGKNVEWQLINNRSGGSISEEAFEGTLLASAVRRKVAYNTSYYPDLAVLFSKASEENIGSVEFINEFTNVITIAKTFAVGSTVKVKAEEGGYEYKTLMRLMNSHEVNELIAKNNDVNNLEYFNFTNAIIDKKGTYVFSNENFIGTNFIKYLSTYNAAFVESAQKELTDMLDKGEVTHPLYYKNHRNKDCIYTVSKIENTDWFVMSQVPLDAFHNTDNYSEGYVDFFASFGSLFLIDIALVLLINHQLRHKTKEAQSANLAKSQFLSSMSHDIRTPMNAIIGMTVIADDALADSEPDIETIKDCVKTIELSGNHLLMLINDILDISKIESGKIALTADDFSISETMEKMLEIVQTRIKEKDLNFESHIVNVGHEYVHADELRINQVFINILTNAIKYTGTGGKITIELAEEPIADKPDIARFIYTVSDTGIGMSEEFQKTIFDRFSRAVDTRINTIEGTGLGMAITKQLVDLMGGTITVKSELNVGSTFTVTIDLPIVHKEEDDTDLSDLSVLFVDDDSVLLKTAEMSLANTGVLIDTAGSGKEGFEAVLRKKNEGKIYDVIFVDWRMPDVSGLDIVKGLREELGASVKIVIMTAYNVADIEKEARNSGADGIIAKPLFRSKLLHTLRTVHNGTADSVNAQTKRHYDLSILVAEDNVVNRKVLDKILKQYDLVADMVENGQIAVDALEKGDKKYDLVLMDIQMPIMDGYTATRAIRSLADRECANVPIYAMTADTFAEDVAACLKCGMNGHLSKPIEIDKLIKVLNAVDEKRAQNAPKDTAAARK